MAKKENPKDYSSETLGPHEETVIIPGLKAKESKSLLTTLKSDWRGLSETLAKKADQLNAWLEDLAKIEKAAPKAAQSIHEETTQILAPKAEAVRKRKEAKYPTIEQEKALEEKNRKEKAFNDIKEAAGAIELQEGKGVSIESFSDAAGYRFKESPEARENQDYVLTSEYGDVVADGMGGFKSGKEAAEIVGKSFMEGLKAVRTADEQKFKNAMVASASQAKERLETLAGKEMTGAAVLASKVLDDLPSGGKRIGVAWSGDVWGGVITVDGKVDPKRQTKDHSLYSALQELRQEKDSQKRSELVDKLVKNLAQSDVSKIPLEEKIPHIQPAIAGWANASDPVFQNLAKDLRKQMFHSINNVQDELRVDTAIFDVAPGESFIKLTDGYTDVLQIPEDIEKAVKIAKETKRPIMQVLTELYLEALSKGDAKEDNIGGTFMSVEIPEIESGELEEELEDLPGEKTNPDITLPDFEDEEVTQVAKPKQKDNGHTKYGIKLPRENGLES